MIVGRTVAIATVGMVSALVAASAASATTPATWSASTAVPATVAASADPQLLSYPGGGMLLYSRDSSGRPTVASFSGGTLGSAEEVPSAAGLGNVGTPEQVAVLANGDAVFSWLLSSDSNATWMAYRFANGTWGAAIGPVDSFDALAARSGELLGVVGSDNSSSITVDRFSIGSDGALTAGTPSTIFSGVTQGIGTAGIALDPSGAADAVLDTSTDGVVEVQRSASGAWGAPVPVPGTAPTSTVYGASNFSTASAPSGAIIASWQLMRHDYTDTAIYAATRQPGGSLASPVPLANASGAESGTGVSRVAAGGDGTLAVDFTTNVCASTSADQVNSYGLAVAAPGGALGSVTSESGPIESLGAGGGEGAVTLESVNTTGFPPGTDQANWPCSGGGFSGNPTLTTTWAFEASIVSSTGQQISSHELASGVTHSPTQTGDFEPSVQAGGLDTAGDAAFLGVFEPSGALDLITYGSPGASGTGTSTGGGGTGPAGGTGGTGGGAAGGAAGGSGSGAGSALGSASSTGSGSGTASVARAGSSGATATVSAACAGASGATCAIHASLSVVETVAGGRVVAVAARARTKHRTVEVGSLETTLAAGSHRQLKVALNAVGRRLLASRHRLEVHLAVTEGGKLVRGSTLTFTSKPKRRP
jgi:hypothetical protein